MASSNLRVAWLAATNGEQWICGTSPSWIHGEQRNRHLRAFPVIAGIFSIVEYGGVSRFDTACLQRALSPCACEHHPVSTLSELNSASSQAGSFRSLASQLSQSPVRMSCPTDTTLTLPSTPSQRAARFLSEAKPRWVYRVSKRADVSSLNGFPGQRHKTSGVYHMSMLQDAGLLWPLGPNGSRYLRACRWRSVQQGPLLCRRARRASNRSPPCTPRGKAASKSRRVRGGATPT